METNLKIFETVTEMFNDRNYRILKKSFDSITAIKPDKRKIILYIIEQKFNNELLKYYLSLLNNENIHHVIFVNKKDMTTSVKKDISSICSLQIEIFSYDSLLFNITKHNLVPRHVCIGMAGDIEKNYPVIKRTDPVCRYYNFKPGSLIQITRRDGSLYFRVVK